MLIRFLRGMRSEFSSLALFKFSERKSKNGWLLRERKANEFLTAGTLS